MTDVRAGLVVLTLTMLAGAACESPAPPEARPQRSAQPPASTDVAPTIVGPEYRTRQRTIDTTGKVQFNEEALVRVHAPATGRVLEIFARPGDVVEPGARLFVMDSADLGAAKADYAKAVADVERSAAAARLSRELFEVHAVAQKELREAENDARKAIAERERAASRLQTLGVSPQQLADIAARADTATTIVVRAPRDGVVVERNVTPGQVVAYGQSDTPVNLFVIADLGTMWVVADVYEPDVPRLRRDEPMVATLRCCPGERYEGRVSYISDAVDKETRTVKVRSIVVNRGRTLKAEMFVNVAIATGTTRALTIPQSAVHRESSEIYVLIVKAKDQLERRPVVLGDDLGDAVEVTSGLGVADRVVSTGSILLKATTR
ncbi:MAG TPA: efflux RND transporter periplasmic adaptor subunit [Candidatus Binatia bacterium]|nr:efflux RND transporter periplasmic adaptor subunit [Candidatus Binatia bacterium]